MVAKSRKIHRIAESANGEGNGSSPAVEQVVISCLFSTSLESAKKGGSMGDYQHIVKDKRSAKNLKRVIQQFKDYFFNRESTWLDIGCGISLAAEVAEELNIEYTGIEKTLHYLYCNIALYPKAKFLGQGLLGEKGNYNIISFISSLHHFQNWKETLEQVYDLMGNDAMLLIDHEPCRLYAKLYKWYGVHICHDDLEEIGKSEIHWFGKPSIKPSDLPEGVTEYNFDYFPWIKYLGLRTKNRFIGQFFESYRKIITKRQLGEWILEAKCVQNQAES